MDGLDVVNVTQTLGAWFQTANRCREVYSGIRVAHGNHGCYGKLADYLGENLYDRERIPEEPFVGLGCDVTPIIGRIREF